MRSGRTHRSSTPTLTVLGVLAAWALVPLVYLLHEASAIGGSFMGADGPFPADQLQYLAWVRDAGEHGLASNLFDMASDRRVFLHPMFTVAGATWRLGVPMAATLVLWKPVAVVALFIGFRRYVRHTVEGSFTQVAVLVSALFFYSPAALVADWSDVVGESTQGQLHAMAGEMFPAGLLWGYLPTVISIALMPLFLLGIERLLDGSELDHGRARRVIALTAAAGLLASWLHPWQGQTLLVIVGGAVVWGRQWSRWRALVVPVVATALPILYYFVLSETVEAWATGRSQNELPRWSLLVLLLGLLPLAAPAAFGATRGATSTRDRLLMLWVPASLVGYFLLAPSFPFHSVEGVSLPLAVLAGRAVNRFGVSAAVVAVAAVALTVPGALRVLDAFTDAVDGRGQPWILRDEEQQAIDAVDAADGEGGTLAPVFLGQVLPAHTGRDTWVGHPSFSPTFGARAAAAEDLFSGDLAPEAAVDLVRQSGTRFLVADCRDRADLTTVLEPILVGVRRFGCATVYEVSVAAPARAAAIVRPNPSSSVVTDRQPMVAAAASTSTR